MDAASRSTGHAGTAGSSGPAAIYWNSAALASEQKIGGNSTAMHMDGLVDLTIQGDVIASADRLVDLLNETSLDVLQQRFDSGTLSSNDIGSMFGIIDGIIDLTEPGSGVLADVGGGLALQRGSTAVSYRYYSRIGLSAVLDTGPESGLSLADDGMADLNDGLNGIVQQRIDNGRPLNRPATQGGRLFSQQVRNRALEQGVNMSVIAGDELAFQGEQVFGSELSEGRTSQVLDLMLDSTAAATGSGSSEISVSRNRSGLQIRGIRFHELTIARGLDLRESGHDIDVGIAGRILRGKTFLRRITFREIEDGSQLLGDVFDSFDSQTRESTRLTLDGGLKFSPAEWVTLGLSGRNLIPISFPFANGTEFDLEPQVRAGVSFQPSSLPWLRVMADIDLTENESGSAPGYESRILGGGFEITSRFKKASLSLRGGTFVNLAANDPGQVYTAGLELRYGVFFMSAEGHVTADNVNIESASLTTSRQDFPERLGGSVAMGINVPF